MSEGALPIMVRIVRKLIAGLIIASAVFCITAAICCTICQGNYELIRYARRGKLVMIRADPDKIERMIVGPWPTNESISWTSYSTRPTEEYVASHPPPPYLEGLDGFRPGNSGLGWARYSGRYELMQDFPHPKGRGRPSETDTKIIAMLAGSSVLVHWWLLVLLTFILPFAWLIRFIITNRHRPISSLFRKSCPT
jgi:hypothetical protein